MVHRQCVDPYLRNITVPAAVLGDHECDISLARDTILPIFEKRLRVKKFRIL